MPAGLCLSFSILKMAILVGDLQSLVLAQKSHDLTAMGCWASLCSPTTSLSFFICKMESLSHSEGLLHSWPPEGHRGWSAPGTRGSGDEGSWPQEPLSGPWQPKAASKGILRMQPEVGSWPGCLLHQNPAQMWELRPGTLQIYVQ